MKVWPIVMVLFIVTACGGGGGGSGGGQRQEDPTGGSTDGSTNGSTGGTTGSTTGGSGGAKFDVTLDSELTPTERTATRATITTLESLKIDGSKINGFSEVFKGNRSSNVISYLESRVNYIFSENTFYTDRLVLESALVSPKFQTFAFNLSRDIWYTSVINEPQDVRIVINNRRLDITSSRIGVVNLGDIFTQSDDVTKAITLVHEARHSDCPDGAKASEIERWFNGQPPIDRTCGQLHSDCGGFSCDSFAWGPYAIDFIYSISIARACDSCTETQKQQGQVNANMVQSSAFDIIGTLNGSYGPPDMGNSTQVENDL